MSAGVALVLGTAVLQVAFAAYILTRRDLEASRRRLAFALAVTVPGFGPTLAVLALAARGAGTSPALRQPVHGAERDRSEYARVLRDQPPLVYRLAGTRSERLAALSELARDESPAAVAALRWILERGERDAVVDAALTLEQMIDARMSEVAAGRMLIAEASAHDLVRLAERVAAMIECGLAEPSTAGRLAGVAREFYRAAEERGGLPGRATAGWARLELRSMHPVSALEILDRHPPTEADDGRVVLEMIRARRDAMFATRA
ncbi:MAG TPA: hypothetical protein VFU21_27810, partial [Kofleriaceae bacterium]|nr:hypothetical protein [Kofleriaceae bacterium]